ncbi:Starch-binding associating with outer membrane [Nonlabens sp. Hel1_33_55]|uniref:RagB/SusD family nutrient uptake outer membrane protein n=1 Tax=Nonlabens sp. Hel1_33_55 TaxID=1336802 RepID=UPI000875E133|nr:RagB/SusD family nutrient uptake outer membrane protein [Nonlabens sp. Hel1_33_55]SCY14827.1 Starch-binding associating with outer membrane [Nonlabens sp. Hel1_33_55]
MKKIIYIMALLLATVSCSDFLDVEPDEQISIDEQLSTADGALAAISGIYNDVETIVSSKVHLYPGIQSGNMTFTPSLTTGEVNVTSGLGIEATYNFENTPDDLEFDTFYSDCYNTINQANLLLERLNQFDFFTAAERQQIQAKLLAIRAFCHYHISLLFSQNINFTSDGSHLGIVYNQQVIQAGTDFPARVSVAETYELLQQDLDNALSLFTDNQIIPTGSPVNFFNELTTKALYARVALQYNDWETAATLAGDVITTSGLQLTLNQNYLSEWSGINDLSESIIVFATPRTSEGDVSSSIAAYYVYAASNNYGDFVASGDLLDLYSSSDIRSQLYIPQELSTATPNGREDQTYFFCEKYQPGNQTLYMRLSEMYLTQAEALERLTPGNPTSLRLLNDIRTRAGLVAVDDSADILEEIFLERRREFAFEAMTFYDIIRYQKDIVRNQGCLANPCNLEYPSPFYILPIPRASIVNNENMIQNEGY